MPSGRLLTMVTAEPILHLGAGLPEATRRRLRRRRGDARRVDAGAGVGELAPAAKIGLDPNGAVLIDDYGATVVWLNELAKK